MTREELKRDYLEAYWESIEIRRNPLTKESKKKLIELKEKMNRVKNAMETW